MKVIIGLLEWFVFFGIFIPYGYLPIYWALPVSFGCFIVLAARIAKTQNEKGN